MHKYKTWPTIGQPNQEDKSKKLKQNNNNKRGRAWQELFQIRFTGAPPPPTRGIKQHSEGEQERRLKDRNKKEGSTKPQIFSKPESLPKVSKLTELSFINTWRTLKNEGYMV